LVLNEYSNFCAKSVTDIINKNKYDIIYINIK